MTVQTIRITDDADRPEIEQAIRALRFKQDRMPAHWVDRRAEVGEEIDDLVTRWLDWTPTPSTCPPDARPHPPTATRQPTTPDHPGPHAAH